MDHSSNNGYSGPLSFGAVQHLDNPTTTVEVGDTGCCCPLTLEDRPRWLKSGGRSEFRADNEL